MAFFRGMPEGRQRASGSSFPLFSRRILKIAAASGWNGTSAGLRSAAMLIRYLMPSGSQIPSMLGFPSGVFGAGAERFGAPVARRGMPGVFTVHCAIAGRDITQKIAVALIGPHYIRLIHAREQCPRPIAWARGFRAIGIGPIADAYHTETIGRSCPDEIPGFARHVMQLDPDLPEIRMSCATPRGFGKIPHSVFAMQFRVP